MVGPEEGLQTEQFAFSQHVTIFLIEDKQQEAVLKATTVRSPLPVMSPILPCPPCLPQIM